ncbi:MAG: protein kinase [Phycisphaerae bacterium]
MVTSGPESGTQADAIETIGAPVARAAGPSPVVLPVEVYAVGAEIAHGGMGSVLQAEDRKLGRVVAMKVMRLEAAASESHRARFVREATVLARLEHPNIVPIHELGFDADNRLYYTMKMVQGRTLQGILNGLRRRDPDFLGHYTLDRLLTIFRKICDAMSLAHAKGVIHRDLKPDNIMVGEFGEVLVMDWGLAKILGDAQQAADEAAVAARAVSGDVAARFAQVAGSQLMRSVALTLDGDVMGTPLYMSPEQAQGSSAEIDRQSDVFALGAILYALLTLHPPVSGGTADEIIARIKRGDIPPPTVYNAPSKSRGPGATGGAGAADPKQFQPLPHCPGHKVPSALSAVTMRALAVDKARRYASVGELSSDIEAYQGGFATGAEHAGLWTQLRLLVQRHKREFTVAFAAWLVITGLLAWFVINLRASERETRRQADIALRNANTAAAEAERATKARQAAVDAEADAVRERETARAALAKSQLDLAEKEFERGNFVEAQKVVDQTPDAFRDANWRFLRAHARDFTAQLTIPRRGGALRMHVLPGGDRFVVRCHANVVGVFATATGRQVGGWMPVTGYLWGTFGVDAAGRRVAVAASGNEVAVYDLATGTVAERWATDGQKLTNVLLARDGRTVVTTAGLRLVAHDARTGAPLWSRPFQGVVPAFAPDGRTVAVAAPRDGLTFRVELIDAATGDVRKTLEASADNNAGKEGLQFAEAGDRLALFGGDEVIVWDARTGAKVRGLHFAGERVGGLSPKGDVVATFAGNRIRLWDAATGGLLRSLNGATTEVAAVAFAPDGATLLSSQASGGAGVVNVWPTRLAEEVASLRPPGYRASRVTFDRDGGRFFTAARNVGVGQTRAGLEPWSFATRPANIIDLAVHPIDGSIVLSEMSKPALARVSADGQTSAAWGTVSHASVRFNGDGRLLLTVDSAFAAADAGRAFSVLEYPSGNTLRKVPLNPNQPFAAFCAGDAAVATAGVAGGITIWDWRSGTTVRQIPAAQTGSIACLAASPDGRRLATGGPDRWIRVWDVSTGRREAAFRAHWEGVRCLKFSADGGEILTGGEDGSVRLHDANTGDERLAFYGLTAPVVDVDFSPNGALVAAVTTEGLASVWDRTCSGDAARLPDRPARVVKPDTEGWENLLAHLTPDEIETSGRGWRLSDGELFSPEAKFGMLQLPADVSGVSYRVRIGLRRLAGKDVFHVALPVGGRMTGFELDGFGGKFTGLNSVNGKVGKEGPGVVEGAQVTDQRPHDLEIAVTLHGDNATIAAALDARPIYAWTGPIASLKQTGVWATTKPGFLAVGTYAPDWAVAEVRVRRLPKEP